MWLKASITISEKKQEINNDDIDVFTTFNLLDGIVCLKNVIHNVIKLCFNGYFIMLSACLLHNELLHEGTSDLDDLLAGEGKN